MNLFKPYQLYIRGVTMPKSSGKARETIIIDPSLMWERKLHYMEKQSGWQIYKAVFWGIYLFIFGILAVLAGYGVLAYGLVIGWAIVVLSIFLIVYGFTISLHYKFLKRHG